MPRRITAAAFKQYNIIQIKFIFGDWCNSIPMVIG